MVHWIFCDSLLVEWGTLLHQGSNARRYYEEQGTSTFTSQFYSLVFWSYSCLLNLPNWFSKKSRRFVANVSWPTLSTISKSSERVRDSHIAGFELDIPALGLELEVQMPFFFFCLKGRIRDMKLKSWLNKMSILNCNWVTLECDAQSSEAESGFEIR